MRRTSLWYGYICHKSINFKSKSKHNKSKSHDHKEKFRISVKELEFIRQDINRIASIFINCARD